jgi:hypothetical protein
MTRVLFVGQQPETVDFTNPAIPPGMNAEKKFPHRTHESRNPLARMGKRSLVDLSASPRAAFHRADSDACIRCTSPSGLPSKQLGWRKAAARNSHLFSDFARMAASTGAQRCTDGDELVFVRKTATAPNPGI